MRPIQTMPQKISSRILLIVFLSGMVLAIAACSKDSEGPTIRESVSAEPTSLNEEQPQPVCEKEEGISAEDQARLIEKWGIKVRGVRLSAAGYMLDFRYRVIDSEKAVPLMSEQAKPLLIDQRTGAKMIVPNPPKVGPLRQKSREPIVDRIYFVMFANPGRFIKAGDKVAVAIGDCRIKDLIVQ